MRFVNSQCTPYRSITVHETVAGDENERTFVTTSKGNEEIKI